MMARSEGLRTLKLKMMSPESASVDEQLRVVYLRLGRSE